MRFLPTVLLAGAAVSCEAASAGRERRGDVDRRGYRRGHFTRHLREDGASSSSSSGRSRTASGDGGAGEEPVVCLTAAQCARRGAQLGYALNSAFTSEKLPNYGCFAKGPYVYFGGGTVEQMSTAELPQPNRVRVWCDGLEQSDVELGDGDGDGRVSNDTGFNLLFTMPTDGGGGGMTTTKATAAASTGPSSIDPTGGTGVGAITDGPDGVDLLLSMPTEDGGGETATTATEAASTGQSSIDPTEGTGGGVDTDETASGTPTASPSAGGDGASETPFPTVGQSDQPSGAKSESPSVHHSDQPSVLKSERPSVAESESPSVHHSDQPSVLKSESPSVHRSDQPSATKSDSPSVHHSDQPSVAESESPSVAESESPSVHHSDQPSVQKSESPSVHHSDQPSVHHSPTAKPVFWISINRPVRGTATLFRTLQ